MVETRGMSRREKLQYEAKQRRLNGESKLNVSIAAATAVNDDKKIDKLLSGIVEIGEDNTEASTLTAYAPEFMYGTDEENASDWANAGINIENNNMDW